MEMRRRLPRPVAAVVGRWLRNRWWRRLQATKPTPTPFGFVMRGDASMLAGDFEAPEVAYLRVALPAHDVFVDVGANYGYFSLLASTVVPHVVAIEPVWENVQILCSNLEANATRSVEVLPVALGERTGVARIYNFGTGASLLKGWSDRYGLGGEGAWAPLRTLDSLLEGRHAGARLLIKIDVEGAEQRILEGATATLARTPAPSWMVEIASDQHHPDGWNPYLESSFGVFFRSGYQCKALRSGARVSPETVREWQARRTQVGEYNFLFSKAG